MQIKHFIDMHEAEQLARLVQTMSNCDETDFTTLHGTFKAIFEQRIPEIALTPMSDRDRVLLANIRGLLQSCEFVGGRIKPPVVARMLKCDTSNGPLAGPFRNSAIEWLNVIINNLIIKSGKYCVVTAIKNEGPWLLEWIAYNKVLGVDEIVIYYNDCDDGSVELLQRLAEANEIRAVESIVSPGIAPQRQAFAHAFTSLRLVSSSEWVAFIDVDEFIAADEPFNDLDAMMQAVCSSGSEQIDCIAINWDWFSKADQFEWEAGLVVDRFNAALKHDMKKCIFRPESAKSIIEVHYPTLLEGARAIDSEGAEIVDLKVNYAPKHLPTLRVNHYFARSFQEFALKKHRGRGSLASALNFDAFLWATVGTSERTMNKVIREKLGRETIRLGTILGVEELSSDAEKRARERLETAFDRAALLEMYDEVRRNEQVARQRRATEHRNATAGQHQ